MSIKADPRVMIEVRKHYGDKTKRSAIWITDEMIDDMISDEVLVKVLGEVVLKSIKAVRD